MRMGIIGGGVCGLSAAYQLSKRGIDVVIFEKEKEIGGLAGSFKINSTYLEKYYHHFFLDDNHIIELVNELNLEDKLITKETRVGFYCDGRIYPFSTPLDLLKFAPLNIFDRFRLGLVLFYFQRLKKWKELDGAGAQDWLSRHCGRNTYNKIWKPLLKTKFGDALDNISVAWIWGRVHERGHSRSSSGLNERLCYFEGGFKTLTDALVDSIKKNNGEICYNSEVVNIRTVNNHVECTLGNNEKRMLDRVISTIPLPTFLEIMPEIPEDYREKLSRIAYRGVICVCLKLRESLSDIYWMNISDPAIITGGIIEHTNFISKEHYNNSHIVYLFNYIDKADPLRNKTDDELLGIYLSDLKRIFPNFKEGWIEKFSVHHDGYATPVYTKGYSQIIPDFKTPLSNIYLANTSQIYPYDRTINNSIKIGKEVSKLIT